MKSFESAKNNCVLIVEDNSADSYVLARYLKKEGLAVEETKTIATAKEALLRAPSIAFIDVGLPDGSGLELCKEIKKHPGTSQIHVILVSATRDTISGISAFLECGAHSLLVKPISASELIPLVQSLLSQTEVKS